MRGGVPFGTLELAGAAPSVLCLHGFGATPQEVAMAVDVARDLGLRAIAPLLPGHGLSVTELARTRFADWREAAEREFSRLLPQGPVILVGSSMGSLLALDLAADHPHDTLGVAALSPALRLAWPFPGLGLWLVSALGIPDFSLPKRGADIRDASQRKSQITYAAQPAYAGNEVRLAGRRVARRLSKIHCPVLVVHGAQDHVCPVSGALELHRRLATPSGDKELLVLPRSYHIVTRDVERGIVRTRLYEFIFKLRQRARRQAPVEPYPPPALPVVESSSTSSI